MKDAILRKARESADVKEQFFRAEADRMLTGLAARLRREPEELREQVSVGSAEHCAELLSRYRDAGCERVYFWPLGDEPRQIELIAEARRRL